MQRLMIADLLCLLLMSSLAVTAQDENRVSQSELPWWNDRVFYEIFVRSFYDSDGDGVGDIQGVIEKLDYLNDGDPATTDDLGVTGLWLMPVMESPSYHGYDTIDYRQIDEEYGTNEDFQALIDAAHQRGMVVIVDLVINHTSTQNPWFIESQNNPDGEYGDWYLWADQAPSYKGPWGQTVWHRAGGRFYYAVFAPIQPDLNHNNMDVLAEIYDVSRFWLEDMGADGFRLDAIKHLIEQGTRQENTPKTLDWLEGYHDYVHWVDPDALMVGEVWSPTSEVVRYIDDKVDLAFEFDLAGAIIRSVNGNTHLYVRAAYNNILETYPQGQFATFLTNHDHDRVMSQLGEDERKAKVAATLLLTSPGVPFIYYGEEIGMIGQKPDERIRTPMQWTDDATTGGFTTGQPWEELQSNVATNNVAAMDDDPDSLLNHYRALVNLRNEHPALRYGEMIPAQPDHRGLYSYIRKSEEETLLIFMNLTPQVISTDFSIDISGAGEVATAELIFGDAILDAPGDDLMAYMPMYEVPPYSSFVIKLR